MKGGLGLRPAAASMAISEVCLFFWLPRASVMGPAQ